MTVGLDPEMEAELIARAKKQIRARMKAIRSGHPAAALAERGRAIEKHLLSHAELASAKSVALFWPMVERGEVDLRGVDRALRERGVVVYYPFMDPSPEGGFSTGFRLTTSQEELEERGRGFFEPPRSAKVAQPGDVDVVIVPALAVDARGHRIGYGAGYYDATLADVSPPARTIIVAYQFQMLAELPVEKHDVPCDIVVTDAEAFVAGNAAPPPKR